MITDWLDAFIGIDDRDGASPIALPTNPPIAQSIVGRDPTNAEAFQARCNRIKGSREG